MSNKCFALTETITYRSPITRVNGVYSSVASVKTSISKKLLDMTLTSCLNDHNRVSEWLKNDSLCVAFSNDDVDYAYDIKEYEIK